MAPLDACVRRFAAFTQCGPAAALNAASLHPARVLGDGSRGHLGVGARCDLVLLDEGLRPLATYLAGELAWRRGDKAL